MVYGNAMSVTDFDSLRVAMEHSTVTECVLHCCLPEKGKRGQKFIGICQLVGFQQEVKGKLPGE